VEFEAVDEVGRTNIHDIL